MKPSKLSRAATFLIEYLDLPEATGIPGASWEAFQLQHLNNESLLAITDKSRQIGWSWIAAAEAVAYACLNKRQDSIFTSINQDEAGEKIRYAKQIIESLDSQVRPRLIIDNRLEIEFQNGSRLISHPCRPVRGKARSRVYLDEFAHYAQDRDIYKSALPVTTKGGVIRIGSTPLGAGGMFWEIFDQKLQPYPGYVRFYVPWWRANALCKDTKTASVVVPSMQTDERVKAFGTDRLVQIFQNMVLEDFQQEYECNWIDDAIAWIDWELIKKAQALDQAGNLVYVRAKSVDQAMVAIEQVAALIQAGKIEPVLAGGGDIGRKRDTTEFIFVGRATTGQIPYRLGITLDRVEFDDQAAVLNRALEILPVSQFLIDGYGIGMQLAENAMRRWGDKVQTGDFTNENKSLWAVELKLRFQRQEIPIPTLRDLAYQIHSVRRKVTDAKTIVFDVEEESEEKHHADQFWALALAAWAAKSSVGAEEWINAMKAKRVTVTP